MVTKESIIRQLKERGLKITPQQLAIIDVFITTRLLIALLLDLYLYLLIECYQRNATTGRTLRSQAHIYLKSHE